MGRRMVPHTQADRRREGDNQCRALSDASITRRQRTERGIYMNKKEITKLIDSLELWHIRMRIGVARLELEARRMRWLAFMARWGEKDV